MPEPMSPQREAIVRREMADTTFGNTWHIRENTVEGTDVWEVTHDGTVLATLPDWAGNLAMEIADAPDNTRQLFASVDQLRAELAEARTKLAIAERQARELDQALGDVIRERDFADDMADKLAYAVAPIEIIGEHSSGNCPWQNALDLITPAPEVDRLRKENADLEAGLGLNEAA